jgi:hypothetical protein
LDLDGEKKRLTVPISWHTDGVRIFKQQKAWIYSFSSALKKGPSLESKLLFLVIRDSLLVKHDSHDAVATIIAWVHRALAEGRFPAADASGQPWAANTREAQQAGSLFASGRCFAFSSFRGDWEARATSFSGRTTTTTFARDVWRRNRHSSTIETSRSTPVT